MIMRCIRPYIRRLIGDMLRSSVLMFKYLGSCIHPLDDESTTVAVDQFSKHVANLHADTDLGFSQEYEVSFLLFYVRYFL